MYDTYPASAGLAVKSLSFFPQLLFVKKGGVFHLSRPHSHTERCLKVQLLSSCFFFFFSAQTLQASQLHLALSERLSKGAAAKLDKATLQAYARRKEVETSAQRLTFSNVCRILEDFFWLSRYMRGL